MKKKKPAPKSKRKPQPKPARVYAPRDQLQTVLQTSTQREAAQKIGVSVRTLQRIKNDKKYKPSEDTVKLLAKAGNRERKKLRTITPAKARRAAQETIADEHYASELPKKPRGKAVYTIPEMPVVPPSQRLTRLDPRDKELKTRMWSDVIDFDVRKMSIPDIVNLLRAYRDSVKGQLSFKIVYQVPKGKTSIGGGRYPKAGNSGTEWERLDATARRSGAKVWTDAKIHEFVQMIVMGRKQKGGGHNLQHVQIQRTK